MWGFSVIVAGFVILPWFYVALGLVILYMTVTFFGKVKVPKTIYRHRQDRDVMRGLWIGLFWSVAVAVLDFLAFIGLDFASGIIYFSDSRNWFKYPVIILVPIIWGLILENIRKRKLEGRSFRKSVIADISRAGS